MKYEYKTVSVGNQWQLNALNDLYAEGWEFVSASNSELSVFYTLRKAIA